MKLGLIGYGYWGRNVARALARVGDLTHIAEHHHGRLMDANTEWGPWGVQATTSEDVVFDACDAVWIATPPDTHAGLVRSALNMGCHVMCEKPFVLHVQDAMQLAAVAEQRGLTLMVGHLSLHTTLWSRLVVLQSMPDRRPKRIELVRTNTQPSLADGSVLWGLGPHDVAMLTQLWGPPDTVEADGTAHRMVAQLGWEDGDQTATVELDWLALEKRRVVRVDGESLAVNDAMEPLLREARTWVRTIRDGGDVGRLREAVNVTETLARIAEAAAL